jgi:hypothetical protein
VGNYEKDTKPDDDRLPFLARRSFPDLSPPYPTLFMTLTLGLGASSIQGFLRRPSRPRSAFANASTLPTNVNRPDDLRGTAVPSPTVQPPIDNNNGLPTHSTAQRGHDSRRQRQTGRRCRPAGSALITSGNNGLSWKFRMRAVNVSEKVFGTRKFRKTYAYYGNAFTALHDSSSCYCCVLDFILLLLLLTGAAWFSPSRRVLA